MTQFLKDITDFQVSLQFTSKKILQYAVILIGFGMNLKDIILQGSESLPNHIVAKGMTRKIRTVYPNANIVAVNYDPSARKVNQENRLKQMLSNARLIETFT